MKNKKLKLARLERDMSQADLAQAVGVTRQTIGLIESDDLLNAVQAAVGEL